MKIQRYREQYKSAPGSSASTDAWTNACQSSTETADPIAISFRF